MGPMTKARSLKRCLRAWLKLTEHRGGGDIPKFTAYEAASKLRELRGRAVDMLKKMRGASDLAEDFEIEISAVIRDFGEATRFKSDPFEIGASREGIGE